MIDKSEKKKFLEERIQIVASGIVQGALLNGDFQSEDTEKLLNIVLTTMEQFQKVLHEFDLEYYE
jgi:hypothetical protein